jgi:hypothetical protein
MTVNDCYSYVQDRLNTLSTNSGDNIPKHTFVRAFNAMQNLWVESRCKLSSTNSIRIDEIQNLSTPIEKTPVFKQTYSEIDLPENYLHYRRCVGYTPCLLYLFPKKEEDVNRLLSDDNWKPSLEWGESFYTIVGNKVKIYGDFPISKVEFIYFRKPTPINMEDGFEDVNGQITIDVNPDSFSESSIIEILNQTVLLLSSDTGDAFRTQTIGNIAAQNT